MDGTVHLAGGRSTVRFERRLAHPPEKVWRALTEPAQLASWFPVAPDWELTPGAKIRFELLNERAPAGEGEIIAVDPPRLLEYSWDASVLRWELTPDGDGTRLVFTDTSTEVERVPQELAGWHVGLEALDASLLGRPLPYSEQLNRLEELLPRYA